MDVAGIDWTLELKHIHMYKYTDRDTHTQEGKVVSVNVCTSTTLSNMWARGRKESMASSGMVLAQDWKQMKFRYHFV